jgi:hypothetical protein
MRVVVLLAVLAAALVATGTALGGVTHRHRCHINHTCPSDHATYRWRGLLCVKPTSDERTSAFRRRVVYSGRVYFCHR